MLVALAVVSTAATLFFLLFRASYTLEKASRQERVAAELAKELLVNLEVMPGQYSWPDLVAGRPAEIRARGGQGFPAPSSMPAQKAAGVREQNFYDHFTWHAYATLPRPDAGYLEVTAVVHWQAKGRKREFVLTSCLPRSIVGGSA